MGLSSYIINIDYKSFVITQQTITFYPSTEAKAEAPISTSEDDELQTQQTLEQILDKTIEEPTDENQNDDVNGDYGDYDDNNMAEQEQQEEEQEEEEEEQEEQQQIQQDQLQQPQQLEVEQSEQSHDSFTMEDEEVNDIVPPERVTTRTLQGTSNRDDHYGTSTNITDNEQSFGGYNDDEFINVPICVCGQEMLQFDKEILQEYIDEDESNKDAFWCYCCEFTFNPEMTDDYFFHCSNCKMYPKGYNLCKTCTNEMVTFNDEKIRNRHKIENLYFIYNNSKINGPFTVDEIITTYVHRKFDTTTLYVMRADQGNDEWTKLTFPQNIYTNELPEYDEGRFELIKECAKENAVLKTKYSEIYDALIEDVLVGKIRMVEVPSNIPADEQGQAIFQKLVRFFGKILAAWICLVLFLHCCITLILGAICYLILYCVLEKCKCNISDRISVWAVIFIYGIAYSGMILWPIFDYYLLYDIFGQNRGDEQVVINNISHSIWAVTSYVLTIIYVSTAYLQTGYQTMSEIILSIILFDFDGMDLIHTGRDDLDWVTFMGTIFIFPSCVALLPAAAFGYVLSATNTQSTYTFVGGLAGYILAAWVIIRLAGYLLVNAFPQLEIYVDKKKTVIDNN